MIIHIYISVFNNRCCLAISANVFYPNLKKKGREWEYRDSRLIWRSLDFKSFFFFLFLTLVFSSETRLLIIRATVSPILSWNFPFLFLFHDNGNKYLENNRIRSAKRSNPPPFSPSISIQPIRSGITDWVERTLIERESVENEGFSMRANVWCIIPDRPRESMRSMVRRISLSPSPHCYRCTKRQRESRIMQ